MALELPVFNIDHFDPYLPCISDKIFLSCDHCRVYKPNIRRKLIKNGNGFYLSLKNDSKRIIFIAFRCLELEVLHKNKCEFTGLVNGFYAFKKVIYGKGAVKKDGTVTIAKVYSALIEKRNIQPLFQGVLTLTEGYIKGARLPFVFPKVDDLLNLPPNPTEQNVEPEDFSIVNFDEPLEQRSIEEINEFFMLKNSRNKRKYHPYKEIFLDI